jgi:ubiquinone/menaquinone biosynthesis C-methylase UbiE
MIGWVIGGLLAIIFLGLVVYWQLAIAEGAYLGRSVVMWLYDWFAPRYDHVKQFRPALDTVMLAIPIMKHLRQSLGSGSALAWVLDVATGTGRLPQTLLNQRNFTGHITAVDLSARMLAIGQTKLSAYGDRIQWLRQDAQYLPFNNDSFDVVTSLEALEFFPDPQQALLEMMRVLKPGGLFIVTNRIGSDAWKMPGRTQPTAALAAWLEQHGLHDAQTEPWLVDYDLIRATK